MLGMMWRDHYYNPVGGEMTRGFLPGLGLQNSNITELNGI